MARPKTIQDSDILDHARSVFLEKGAFGSTKDIAKRAGVSEATLFQRFPTKAALFLAALVPPVVDVESVIGPDTPEADPQAELTAIGHRMFDYFQTLIPTIMHLVAHPAISLTDVSAHFRNMPAQALAGGLAERLRRMADRGEVRVDNPLATASLLASAIHSLAVFELLGGHGDQDFRHAVVLFVKALWGGLAPLEPTSPK